jgi:cyanophycinase
MPALNVSNNERGYIIPIGGAEGKKAKKPSILNRFVDLCGGSDARIMVIPTASLLNETGPQYKALFEEMGAESMCVPIEERDECFNDETLRILDGATGIFITGGNQLRLSTILGGTPVARRIRKLNAKGVHVAGTSAGAAIVSEHMIAGGRSGSSPRESGVELAPGLGLTNRVIIDCGLGIDENTAGFIAPDGRMEVVGKGTVTVVDPADLRHSSMSYVRRAEAVTLIGLKLHVLAEGAHFNLETREATLN